MPANTTNQRGCIMSQELSYLSRLVARGRLDRRAFLGRAAALGVGATFANTMLASAVRAQGPVKGGTLRAGMQGDTSADSLDPGSWTSQVQYSLGRTWGEQLVDLSPEGELLPRLATEWDASDDARQWTFRIREGVEFHDGRTLSADDVTATLRRHSDEDSRSGALGIMRGIESVQTDGDTVVVTTTEANADLPYLMTDYHLMIQPGGGVDNPTEGVGTGPYRVVEFDPGVRHRVVRFENHWNLDEFGHADEIEIIVINDATARTSALQSGQVDIINRVEPRIVDLIARVPGVTIENVSGRGHYVVLMHCNTPPFDNNDLRLALKYAMNREQMLDTILRGYGQIGNDIPINAAYPLFSEEIPQREFDLDRRGTTSSGPATRARSCCAPPRSPSPAPSTRPSSTPRPAPRPASRSRSGASPATATGRRSGTSSRSRRATGADARPRTRCTPPPISPPRNGTTPASSTSGSTTS
jgi:peptide/nickel transport system substrate-binding protein